MAGILVHEWLSPRGGSENVFEVLTDTFPAAERWCLWNASDGRFRDVRETWLARTPLRGRKALSVPVMPLVWRTLPAREADWVLVSSHAFAHHARFGGPASDARKFVYAHTPARYIWVPEADARGASLAARSISRFMKPLDRRRAQEPVSIAANSAYVASRIEATWERSATVIYPPVDVARYAQLPELTGEDRRIADLMPEAFVLGASRFVHYKRLERAIEAGDQVGLPVVLAGGGADEPRLRAAAAAAGVPVTFVLEPSSDLLAFLYARASVMVFAAVEDFGIMPVEAMASGTPVVVNAEGGAGESVVDGVTGVHVQDWSPRAFKTSVERALDADPDACRTRASAFAVPEFQSRVRRWVGADSGGAA